jgi:hypothetical protein
MPETPYLIDGYGGYGGSGGNFGNPPGNNNNPPLYDPLWWSCDRCAWMYSSTINDSQTLESLIEPNYTYENLPFGDIVIHSLHFYDGYDWYKVDAQVWRTNVGWGINLYAVNKISGSPSFTKCPYPSVQPGNNPPTYNPVKPGGVGSFNNNGPIGFNQYDPAGPVISGPNNNGPLSPNNPGPNNNVIPNSPSGGPVQVGNPSFGNHNANSAGNGPVGTIDIASPDWCGDCYTPPPVEDIYNLTLDPFCPNPGYGGKLDPVQGNAVIRANYIQYVGNVDPQSPVFLQLGPQGQSIFVARGWQIYNGPQVQTTQQVYSLSNPPALFANTNPAIRAYLETFNLRFELVPGYDGQDMDCRGGGVGKVALSNAGTIKSNFAVSAAKINVSLFKLSGTGAPSGLFVVGDLAFGAPLYRVTIITTPKPPSGPGPVTPNNPIIPINPINPINPNNPIIPIDPIIPVKPIPTGKIYSNLDPPLITRVETTYGIWSNNVGNLTAQYTCSVSPSSSNSWRRSHYTIFNLPCSNKCAEQQYEVTYGHDEGSGSIDLGGFDNESPTNAIYSQYRLLCLNPTQKKFNIAGRDSRHVYVINIKQARMGDRFDEGNWELNLHHLSGSQHLVSHPVNSFTGSVVRLGTPGKILRLIDDSKVAVNSSSYGGNYYNIVSGSLEEGIYNSTSPKIFGQVFPSLGVIVLDADKLDQSASFATSQAVERHCDNAFKLVMAMSGAKNYTDRSGDVLGFKARRIEINYDRYYFVRIKNAEYNYSNNPTYVTGSEGMIKPEFREVEKVFISSIGFYDQRGNLVAVGKVSKPVLKTRTDEALFTVRLRY